MARCISFKCIISFHVAALYCTKVSCYYLVGERKYTKTTVIVNTSPLYILHDVLEVDVYPNSTTFLLDKLKLFIILNSNNYSSMDQHVSTGQSLHQDLRLETELGFIYSGRSTVWKF